MTIVMVNYLVKLRKTFFLKCGTKVVMKKELRHSDLSQIEVILNNCFGYSKQNN